MADANTVVPPLATRREWIGLAVIALPCLLYAMDLTVLNLALPEVTLALQPSASELLWIVDIYGFLIAGFLITAGTLGDRIGRRRLLLLGSVAFGAASVLAAFSTSAQMLIVARALLGIAGASLAPSTLSLIRNMFLDPRQRTFAIGIWVACFSAGGALGPLVGGVLLTYFWWGSVFLIAVPMMALLLVLGPRLLPEYRDPNPGRLDLWSAALSIVAVLAVIYGVKKIAETGNAPADAVIGIIIGVAIGYAFLRRQRRLVRPLVDFGLLRDRIVATSLTVNLVGLFVFTGTLLFAAQYLQLVLGLDPLAAGLWSAPGGIAFAVASVLAPRIVRRMRPATAMAGGLLVVALGLLVITQITVEGSPVAMVVGVVVLSIGLAPVVTMTTDFVVSAAPVERAGSASAISETSFEFGAALGVAILGSFITAVYRGTMAGAVSAGFPADAVRSAEATLGGALVAADQMGGEAAAVLVAAAREAFTGGIQIGAGVSAALAVGAAWLAWTGLSAAPASEA